MGSIAAHVLTLHHDARFVLALWTRIRISIQYINATEFTLAMFAAKNSIAQTVAVDISKPIGAPPAPLNPLAVNACGEHVTIAPLRGQDVPVANAANAAMRST
ncbi:hypothetical protein BST61_g3109 [Cercospora zeina]